MSEYLSPVELHDFTGYARHGQQGVWLVEHGVPHRLDGKRVILSRIHAREWLEGRTVARSNGLNLAAIK